MRVLVCGGRDFKDSEYLYKILDKLHETHMIDVIIEGDARGADRMAGYWARKNEIDLRIFCADWAAFGKSAGYRRNLKMLDQNPDVVLAFDGGKGTQHTIDNAKKRNIQVIEFRNGKRIK